VLPALVLAALAVMSPTAPPTDLPAAADPCVALTPSVVNQLRTSGALTPLVSDEVPTSTLIVAGRALTGLSTHERSRPCHRTGACLPVTHRRGRRSTGQPLPSHPGSPRRSRARARGDRSERSSMRQPSGYGF